MFVCAFLSNSACVCVLFYVIMFVCVLFYVIVCVSLFPLVWNISLYMSVVIVLFYSLILTVCQSVYGYFIP